MITSRCLQRQRTQEMWRKLRAQLMAQWETEAGKRAVFGQCHSQMNTRPYHKWVAWPRTLQCHKYPHTLRIKTQESLSSSIPRAFIYGTILNCFIQCYIKWMERSSSILRWNRWELSDHLTSRKRKAAADFFIQEDNIKLGIRTHVKKASDVGNFSLWLHIASFLLLLFLYV